MKLYMTPDYLRFYEALSSETRLTVIQLLCEKDRNIKELAEAVGVSGSIMTKHIRKLELAKIVTTNTVKRYGSLQKMCTILNTTYEIDVPFKNNRRDNKSKYHTTSLPVGQFTDIVVVPPCGMASEKKILGDLDEPKAMMEPNRIAAQLLWFGGGMVEYKLPNHMNKAKRLTSIEISGEFGSETAGYKDDWPSLIKVSLNGVEVCSFTTPGDFGESKGSLTPSWWRNNQYGILVVIKVSAKGVFVNGERRSHVTLDAFDSNCDKWTLRFETANVGKNGGGFTIFGEQFGNYSQSIVFKEFYEQIKKPE